MGNVANTKKSAATGPASEPRLKTAAPVRRKSALPDGLSDSEREHMLRVFSEKLPQTVELELGDALKYLARVRRVLDDMLLVLDHDGSEFIAHDFARAVVNLNHARNLVRCVRHTAHVAQEAQEINAPPASETRLRAAQPSAVNGSKEAR